MFISRFWKVYISRHLIFAILPKTFFRLSLILYFFANVIYRKYQAKNDNGIFLRFSARPILFPSNNSLIKLFFSNKTTITRKTQHGAIRNSNRVETLRAAKEITLRFNKYIFRLVLEIMRHLIFALRNFRDTNFSRHLSLLHASEVSTSAIASQAQGPSH